VFFSHIHTSSIAIFFPHLLASLLSFFSLSCREGRREKGKKTPGESKTEFFFSPFSSSLFFFFPQFLVAQRRARGMELVMVLLVSGLVFSLGLIVVIGVAQCAYTDCIEEVDTETKPVLMNTVTIDVEPLVIERTTVAVV
jgi:hypothetical protein